MEKICKNCKMWGDYIPETCDYLSGIGANEGAKRFEIISSADDDQGLEAFLKTGPEFGCVHFVTKLR
jgi:hypothetical protein